MDRKTLITAYYQGVSQTHTVEGWAKLLGVSRRYIYQRRRLGDSYDRIVNLPVKEHEELDPIEKQMIEKAYHQFCFGRDHVR